MFYEKTNALLKVQRDVRKTTELLTLAQDEFERTKDRRIRLKELEIADDKLKLQIRELETKKNHAAAILNQNNEKIALRREDYARKRASAENTLSLKVKEHKQVEDAASKSLRQVENFDSLCHDIHQKIHQSISEHQMEMRGLRDQHENLTHQVRHYHSSLATLMGFPLNLTEDFDSWLLIHHYYHYYHYRYYYNTILYVN